MKGRVDHRSTAVTAASAADAPIPADPLVAIVLLTMDQREKTLRCLESLAGIRGVRYRTLLWDNGSEDGTADAVRELFPEVVVHAHPENLGVASGRNAASERAFERFGPDLVLFLDNDMTVEPDFLAHLVRPFLGTPRLAQTTAKIRMLGREAFLYGAQGCRVDFARGKTNHGGYGERDLGQYDERVSCIPSGGCMLVHRGVFEALGGFDPGYDPYGPEDLDFGLRVKEAGLLGLYVPEAVVYHQPRPGKTFTGSGYSSAYARNKARLWLRLLHRHGTAADKLRFYGVGMPMGVARRVISEVRRGNVGAVVGLARGALDALSGKTR